MHRNSRGLAALLRHCIRQAETRSPAVLPLGQSSRAYSVLGSLPVQGHQIDASGAVSFPPNSGEGRPPARGFASQGSDAPDPHPAGKEASNEIDSQLQKAADSGDVSAVYSIIEERGEMFSESNVTSSFASLAKLAGDKSDDIHGSTSFQTLVDMVILGIRRYSTQQLLSVVASCAELGYDGDMLMDKVTARLLKNVEHLDAPQLLDLVTSLAGAESSPSVVFFDALQARAEALGKDVTDDMKKQLQDAYSKLGYDRLKEAAKDI